MELLIDGYNLMHAAGYLTSRATRPLEPIRKRFLDWLNTVAVSKQVAITVVFDGHGPQPRSTVPKTSNLRIRYSHHRTADDDIESLLSEVSVSTTVISNDSRLHEAARRARQSAWRSEQFFDWMLEDARTEFERERFSLEKPTINVDESELLAEFLKPRSRPR